ncbi:hypothetical protein GEMRC1_008263 [Eukaryota sp. GEM-RC1]
MQILNLESQLNDVKSSSAALGIQIQRLFVQVESAKSQKTPSEILFSRTEKSTALYVSNSSKTVLNRDDEDNNVRNILGTQPLFPGNIYSWKLGFRGPSRGLWVGVIDEGSFETDAKVHARAHCFHNHGCNAFGCLSGRKSSWNETRLLEITVDMIRYSMTMETMNSQSIRLSGRLPIIRGRHYYPFVSMHSCEHEVMIHSR